MAWWSKRIRAAPDQNSALGEVVCLPLPYLIVGAGRQMQINCKDDWPQSPDSVEKLDVERTFRADSFLGTFLSRYFVLFYFEFGMPTSFKRGPFHLSLLLAATILPFAANSAQSLPAGTRL